MECLLALAQRDTGITPDENRSNQLSRTHGVQPNH
jgi:hypothetical protein